MGGREPEQDADRVLETYRAKGDLGALVVSEVWLVADVLCARGEFDAAADFGAQ